ncbi:MAG: hypothetical protein ABI619_12365, partial [Betaproteobacteria bacterium]
MLAILAFALHAFAPFQILGFAPLSLRACLLFALGSLYRHPRLLFLLTTTLLFLFALAQLLLLFLEFRSDLRFHCPQAGQVKFRQIVFRRCCSPRKVLAAQFFRAGTLGCFALVPLLCGTPARFFLVTRTVHLRIFPAATLILVAAPAVFLFAACTLFLLFATLALFLRANAFFLFLALALFFLALPAFLFL